MLAEFGHIFLIGAFCLSILQLVKSTRSLLSSSDIVTFEASKKTFFLTNSMLFLSFFILIMCFVKSDFSVLNVYNNSHTNKPLIYKISGTWGNHEGSLSMWLGILGIYGNFLILKSRNLPKKFSNSLYFAISIIYVGFIGFTIFTSNPFLRNFPIANEGNGLNPVLQDPGLAFHPPLLYMGYVGLTIPFAFAIAALLQESVNPQWAKWVRPWILISWIFLTLGISLGSWWAYYELGWGGWWFWDPVENISLLPWLLATALLHSTKVTEKRNNLRSWTILLAILAFSLTLLGTFIVRSGLLTSVHAFASDPARGIYILSFLFLVTSSSLLLYAVKFDKIENSKSLYLTSREGGLLINNIFFCASAFTILLGTLWPLIIEFSTGKDISVGAPFFKIVFLPLILPAIYLSGFSINLKWSFNNTDELIKKFWKVLVILFFLILSIMFITRGPIMMIIGVAASIWIVLSILTDLSEKLNLAWKSKRIDFKRLFFIKMSTYGMYLAHLGVGVLILGITLSDHMKQYYEGTLLQGTSIRIADYDIKFLKTKKIKEKNWVAEIGEFSVKNKLEKFTMFAERRIYLDTGMPTTEAAIKRSVFSHLYIVMGPQQPAGSGKRVIRIYYNPFIILIWSGTLIMAFGGIVSMLERSTRLYQQKKNEIL